MSEAKPDAKRNEGVAKAAQTAWVALFAFAIVVGASSFALTYHGLYGYGHELARLGLFSWLVPVAVDGATLFAIAATFLLAKAPKRVRVYAWLVFAVANAASVAGNLAYAGAKHLPWQGAVGAAAWPVLVTLVAHLGVVTWRHCAPGSASPTPAGVPKPRPAASPRTDASPAPLAGPLPRADHQPADHTPPSRWPGRSARARGQRTSPQQRADALALLDEGRRPAEAALAVGVSKRTVEIWRKERVAAAARSPSAAVRSGVRHPPDTPSQPAPTHNPAQSGSA